MSCEVKKFDFPKAVEAVIDSLLIFKLTHKETVVDYFGGSGKTASRPAVTRAYLIVSKPSVWSPTKTP